MPQMIYWKEYRVRINPVEIFKTYNVTAMESIGFNLCGCNVKCNADIRHRSIRISFSFQVPVKKLVKGLVPVVYPSAINIQKIQKYKLSYTALHMY